MAPTPSTIGPSYKGSRLRIENPSAGRASRNVQSLVPRGYKMVANHGSYIVVERTTGQQAPGTRPAGFMGPIAPAPGKPAAQAATAAKAGGPATTPQQVWLDGVLVTVKLGADGQTYTATPVSGKGAGAQGVRPTAFDALDGQSIEETNPFLMSHAVGAVAGMGPTSAANHMSIKAGVQWLAELSAKDPGAYASMLQKLYNAGYLSKSDLAQAAGHWSASAGQAFALAARDTAVVNTTTSGLNTTLDDFLKSKAGAAAALEADNGKGPYVPVPRNYTDPEDIKATAKGAAEDVLGRQLTAAEEAKLTARFRGLEDAKYNAIDAAGVQGKNASVTDPGSGQISAFVSGDGHEQEAANFRAAEYGLSLKRLFGLG